MNMESQIAKAAAENPELRKFLVPLLKEAGSPGREWVASQLNDALEEINALQEVSTIFRALLNPRGLSKEKMYQVIQQAQKRLSEGRKAYDTLNAVGWKMEALISRDEF